MRKYVSFVLLFFVLFAQGAVAQLRLPAIFGDGMVMQRNMPIPVWGWGTPGEKVKVTLSGKTKTVKVGKDGKWKVSFPAMKAGEFTLNVSSALGKNSHIEGIKGAIGDLFLFSGQSNQELPIRRCMDNNNVSAIARTYTNKDVHILKIPQQQNLLTPQDDCIGAPWVTISPETAQNIGALTYFVGKELQETAGVPIGIINSSVGGTRVEAWMSRENLMQYAEMKGELADIKYHQTNWRDSVNNIEQTAVRKWYADMNDADTVLNKWNTPDYDFSTWQPVNIFDKIYTDVMPHGSYWFHNSFLLSKEVINSLTNGSPLLRLGAMKDADEVYVNGIKVGSTSYEFPPRNYKFPANILREGVNDVVIHLTSYKIDPPFFTREKSYQLELPTGAILLDKGWKMAIGKLMPPCQNQTYFVDTPVGLYNAMIHPLGNLPIRGMVWYQGEANEDHPYHYAEYFNAMIDEWHKQFPTSKVDNVSKGSKIPEPWPSVMVQLANYRDRHKGIYNSGWCDVRDAQYNATITNNSTPATQNSKLSPLNSKYPTYLATAIDCGEWNDIHPQAKDIISHRIALQLRHHVYGENIVSEGPRPISCKTNGNELIIRFSPETGKLRSFNDGIAHTTGDYELVVNISLATKVKSSTYTVVEDSETGASYFRYAHDDNPLCTIYNIENLPSPQFSILIEK